jgi:hypothetical protein
MLVLSICLSSCEGCDGCNPKPEPTNTDRVCIQLGTGTWPSDYYPTSSVYFTPNQLSIESINITVSQVQMVNGNPVPVGGSAALNYDLDYLNNNGWCIEVWKDREYIVQADIIQFCTLDFNSEIWQQTSTGNVPVSCYQPGDIIKGETEWSYYKYVTNYPISVLVLDPVFVQCVDCGCQ